MSHDDAPRSATDSYRYQIAGINHVHRKMWIS